MDYDSLVQCLKDTEGEVIAKELAMAKLKNQLICS